MSLRLVSFFGSALLMPSLVANAAILDSADFAFKYEADAAPTLSIPAWTVENSRFASNSVNDGAYSQTTLPDSRTGALSFKMDDGANWDIQDGVGYTAEIRIRVISAAGTHPRDGVWFDIGDGVNNAGVRFFDAAIEKTEFDSQNTFSIAAANQNNWQVLRLVVSDDHATFDVYLNDALVQGDLATYSYISPLDRIRWGDPTSTAGTTDNAFDIDYIRWDTTGAYAPIPEPASLGLLVIGAGLVARRRGE